MSRQPIHRHAGGCSRGCRPADIHGSGSLPRFWVARATRPYRPAARRAE